MKPLLRNSLLWKFCLLLGAIILFVLSFIFNTLYTNRSSVAEEVKHAENYIHQKQRNFDDFLADTSLIKRLVDKTETISELNRVTNKKYGVFLYTVSSSGTLSMSFWSNQLVLPPPETFWLGEMEKFMHLSNGYYLVIKRTLDISANTIVAYAVIPVRSDFFLETEYLPQEFIYSNTADNRVLLSESVTEFPVKSLSGNILFYLDKKISGAVPYNNRLTILLRFGGLLFLLLFTHLVAESLSQEKSLDGHIISWRQPGSNAIDHLSVPAIIKSPPV